MINTIEEDTLEKSPENSYRSLKLHEFRYFVAKLPNSAIFSWIIRFCKAGSRRLFKFSTACSRAKRLTFSQTSVIAFSSSKRKVAAFASSKRLMSSSTRANNFFELLSAVTRPWARISSALTLANSNCFLASFNLSVASWNLLSASCKLFRIASLRVLSVSDTISLPK